MCRCLGQSGKKTSTNWTIIALHWPHFPNPTFPFPPNFHSLPISIFQENHLAIQFGPKSLSFHCLNNCTCQRIITSFSYIFSLIRETKLVNCGFSHYKISQIQSFVQKICYIILQPYNKCYWNIYFNMMVLPPCRSKCFPDFSADELFHVQKFYVLDKRNCNPRH